MGHLRRFKANGPGRVDGNAGIFPSDEVASYCQTAIRATHGYMVLKLLGYDSLRVYDGSWIEWGNRDDTPIEQ